ncbi:hypothetical protein FGG08_001120 [Glutinoglossum americanum]|uniref:Uncharacterized protein n=1 Tax=Glutinoglossum americanum TaxID=1670608 RepID=A0A9P8L0K0_9PEZI|nr:hypothetical protein FGG08_001120 [Glutinoglossum americanum]
MSTGWSAGVLPGEQEYHSLTESSADMASSAPHDVNARTYPPGPAVIRSPPTPVERPRFESDESFIATDFPPGTSSPVGGGVADNTLDSQRRPSRNHQGLRIASGSQMPGRASVVSSRGSSPAPSEHLSPYTPSPDGRNFATPSETDRLTSGMTSASGEGAALTGRKPRTRVRIRGRFARVFTLVLSIYSTIFSGLYLLIALRRPTYSHSLSTNGLLTPASVQILSTAVARTIELSFVTVFVAFLGQVLVSEAYVEEGKDTKGEKRGITMAEMAMRSWISEPGTILSEWNRVRTAGLSVLGMLCLVATVIAMLYTSAANALVSPKLRAITMPSYQLYGLVKTQFANSPFIESQCLTPMKSDPVNDGTTCLQIWHAGQANHAYSVFLSEWHLRAGSGVPTELSERPTGVGLTTNDTYVLASWLDTESAVPVRSGSGGRIINNVTMAMPHAGVVSVARDQKNNILQPSLNGFGDYSITTPVMTAAVNVLCVEMSREELAPLIFTTFPAANRAGGVVPNATAWPALVPKEELELWMNGTAVDDLFEWGERYNRHPPILYQYPLPLTTLLNDPAFPSDSLYFLAKGPQAPVAVGDNYTLCSLRVSQTSKCETIYRAAGSGGILSANCGGSGNKKSGLSSADAPWKPEPGWVDIGHKWGYSLGLNEGLLNSTSSNARSLAELTLTSPSLSPHLPSMAETLAVLAGCTLIDVTLDTTFRPTWTYSTPTPGVYEPFTAAITRNLYASGGNQEWQKLFYPVLVGVFLANVFILVYTVTHRRAHLTDFTEPVKLFSLAAGSEKSMLVEGGGVGKNELKVRWVVREGPGGRMEVVGVGEEEWRVGVGRGSRLFWSPRGGPGEKRWGRV